MGSVISDYEDLLEVVRSLPPPASGHTRVFRGQNFDYPTMTPTALRAPGAADATWPIYASKLADAMLPEESPGSNLDVTFLWVHAIKQHYGPGTEFLDVTHSLGVATWFALHRLEAHEEQAVYGPQGEFNPETDLVGAHSFLRHSRFEQSPAYLYVLDARTGADSADRKHGTLFDLALAPPPFSTSPRIRVQQACLVYADGTVDGGDVSSLFVAGTPLRIAWPLQGCPELNASTNHMFPPAGDDDWYARFVGLPLAPNLRRSHIQTVFEHPISVSLYLPQGSGEANDRALADDLNHRFVTLRPALLYADTLNDLNRGLRPTEHPLWDRFADATALLLEGPMMTTLPTVSRLNRGLAPFWLSRSTPARDFISRRPAGDASLTNVFVETCALDMAGWERFEQERPDGHVIRGIWLICEDDRFFITKRFYLTVFVSAVGDAPSYIDGPVEIVFDIEPDGLARFRVRDAAQGSRSSILERTKALVRRGPQRSRSDERPLEDEPSLERNFFKALILVRSLSPRWKLRAYPSAEAHDGSGQHTSLVPVEWACGELLSLRNLTGPVSAYHALRQWDSDEPYYGGIRLDSSVIAGAIKLEGMPFPDRRPYELYAAVKDEIARRDGLDPPVSVAKIADERSEAEPAGRVKDVEELVRVLRPKTQDDQESARALAEALELFASVKEDSGHQDGVLPASEEAVALARANDADTRALARMLTNLGVRYGDAGRGADAVAPLEEAVAIWRALAAGDVEDRQGLALTLNNLGNAYSVVNEREKALAAAEEAVLLTRELAEGAPIPDASLARALSNLAGRYRGVGRVDDATNAIEAAVGLYRQAAAADSAVQLDLAVALCNLQICYSDTRDLGPKLTAAEEEVEIYRDVAGRNPGYEPTLVEKLTDLADLYLSVGNATNAINLSEAAVLTYRELTDRDGGFAPHLARALNNLAIRYGESGRRIEAVAPTEESVRIRRILAAEDPDYRRDLARSLDNLGNRYSEVGRHSDAVGPAEEAVAIYREIADDDVDYSSSLASALNNLGNRYSALGRDEEAVDPAERAVSLYKRLALEDSEFLPRLALALANLSHRYTRVQREGEINEIWDATISQFADQEAREFLSSHRPGASSLP